MAMDTALKDARRLIAAKNYPGAIDALRKVESTDENQFDIAYLMGLCHSRLENWDDALLYLEQVATGGVDFERDVQCRLTLAYIYTVTGRHRLAEYELERLRGIGLESAQLFCFLGYTSWAQERIDEGIGWYARALEIEPENANALNGLGYLLACSGRESARALTCCRKAVDKHPSNPAYLDSLAWAYFKLGFIDEARENILRALKIIPESREIRDHAEAIGLGGSEAL